MISVEIWADVTVLVTLQALPPRPELAPKLGEILMIFIKGSNPLMHIQN